MPWGYFILYFFDIFIFSTIFILYFWKWFQRYISILSLFCISLHVSYFLSLQFCCIADVWFFLPTDKLPIYCIFILVVKYILIFKKYFLLSDCCFFIAAYYFSWIQYFLKLPTGCKLKFNSQFSSFPWLTTPSSGVNCFVVHSSYSLFFSWIKKSLMNFGCMFIYINF